MDDPIKILFKYKNNNRRINYHVYVFVGPIPNNILKILKSIQDKSLYESLTSLNKTDYTKLADFYGEFWYKKFFNTYHINSAINIIKKNNQQADELKTRYGADWFAAHITGFRLAERKLFYSYEAIIKDEMLRKEIRRKKTRTREVEEKIDYTINPRRFSETQSVSRDSDLNLSTAPTATSTTTSAEDGYKMDKILKKVIKYGQRGGGDINHEMDDDGDEYYVENADTNGDGGIEFEEGLEIDDLLLDEELDLNENEKIYEDIEITDDVEPDKNIAQTSNLIQMALKDEEYSKKSREVLIEFDTSKDNTMYDENLKNVYYKNYVTSQYIFKDDTIKTVKNKIACSIKNNPKFEKNAFIIPSRQYLWSEYYFDDELEKIMLGQKWIVRTNILQIDNEPNNNFRFYEELRGNLKLLRDNIKRYGSKIKWEDDDFNILYDYENFFSNNELYMIDIYNELGQGYNPSSEELKNIIDVYIKIYFRRIKSDDIKYIIDYLNGDTKAESGKITSIFETLNNDLILENQIMYDFESVKKDIIYKDLFKDNYITQSVIHVNLRFEEKSKIDLFRIFNEFIVTSKYPFIQYQTPDAQIIFKYSEDDIQVFGKQKENMDVLAKWFENAPYGISFKVRITENGVEKFMAINLNDTGRIEYKTQWKEEDMATVNDIKKTYNYVRDLISKLNSEKNNVHIIIPNDNEFKYAFINSIQKFELPGKFNINHNDLSEFSRYFYPYVALVIEPRKRQAKIKKDSEKSKFGTYLRYKRVSKYENKARVEQRILYFMRNYDYSDQSLSNEISKQFNITVESAIEDIERVRNKYPNIKKSRKILKKLENIPKYKPPGIGIDIQGKQRDRYKIRISGARNKDQLDRIITFMNILIYLYVDTYLLKNPDRQILKDKLKKLTNIARRRAKVDEIVKYDSDVKNIKQMAQLDKKRIGFKPEKGQNQYSRSCQNSGTDKKRQPKFYTQLDDLLAQGFKLDKKTGIYEKKTFIKKNGKRKEITIRAVGLGGTDDEGKDLGSIYYSCNPEENGEHMYVGFLSRSNNPYGQCMPCCFKKDPYLSKNKVKRDYFMKCIGKRDEVVEKDKIKVIGDQLYILQDTNKIQEGRFGFLPKYLDLYFNQLLDKTKKIKHHYLIVSKTGYYFKYGTKQDDYPFLTAVAALFDTTASDLIEILIDRLNKDRGDSLFAAINNGDIKTIFQTREKFIDYLRNNTQLTFEILNHFISIPGVLSSQGLNIVVFDKKTISIKRALEKEKIREDFTLLCQNEEEINNLNDQDRETIFLLKELKNFYPIVLVTKENEADKNVIITKTFGYKSEIINHISDFYNKNCQASIITDVRHKKHNNIAKDTVKILIELDNKDYMPKFQVLDARNKCKYIITNNSTIIPVKPSGALYDITIIKHYEIKFLTLNQSIDQLTQLYKLTKQRLPVEPIGVYFTQKTDAKVTIVAVMTKTYDSVPIREEVTDIASINQRGLIMEFKQLYDKIDEEINKGRSNSAIDTRVQEVNDDKFFNESYELFRLELSNYINKTENEKIKKRIEKIITADTKKSEKKRLLKELLYKLVDKNLLRMYQSMNQQTQAQEGGKNEKFVHVINKQPNIINYDIKNIREVCETDTNKDLCAANPHCHWVHDKCYFALTREFLIKFVNKVTEELANNELKASEILQRGDYFVSDVVDYNRFTERDKQKIIKSTSIPINKILSDLFGKEFIPRIGKRKLTKPVSEDEIDDTISDRTLKDLGYFYTQRIIDNNLSLYRAYANGYSWVKHKFYDLDSRNLGYYSNIQTDLANFFRSIIIDWIADKKNYDEIVNKLLAFSDITNNKDIVRGLINRLAGDIMTSTNGIIEYYILSKVYDIPIIVYDDNNDPLYIFENGLIFNSTRDGKESLTSKKYEKYMSNENLRNSVNIRFSLFTGSDVPMDIEVVYYK